MTDYFTKSHTAVDSISPPHTMLAEPRMIDSPSQAVRRVEEIVWSKHLAANPPPQSVILSSINEAPPDARARFIHGGPALHALSAPSEIAPVILTGSETPAITATSIASSNWRAFTDEEEKRLARAWDELQLKEETQRKEQQSACTYPEVLGEATAKPQDSDVADSDITDEPHIIPVGLDRLFSVNLKLLLLISDFWMGSPVLVLRSTWFYPSPTSSSSDPSSPSHLRKINPVDRVLASALEVAYREIKPYLPSYQDELTSALKVGVEAESKLRYKLLTEDEDLGGIAGTEIEVMFQDHEIGRLNSRTLAGAIVRGYGGGQVVVRGWDALERWNSRNSKKKSISPPRKVPPVVVVDPIPDETPSSTSSGFFNTIRSKIGMGAPVTDTTTEAMLPDVKVDLDESEVGSVSELVLVVHGVGQKLAGTFESFNFTHAVNTLRTTCTTLSTSPALSPLLKSKRAQFIPVRWRADLVFEEDEEDERVSGRDGEMLGNRFSLEDAKIDAVPVLRTIIDGMLDVPYYQTSSHKTKMIRAVVREANRIVVLFTSRNPIFLSSGGKISIIAHSLGSTLITDILSIQPTFVKSLNEMTIEEKRNEDHFVFDTRCLFLVGSPLAFFIHLQKSQLIARAGRARSKNVGKDIALDRTKYGCMSIDSIYNIYFETDPVAFMLNVTVDAAYSRLIKPIKIPSSNVGLLKNLQSTYERVTALFWSSSTAESKEEEKKEEMKKLDESIESQAKGEDANDEKRRAKRPSAMKRMPTERPGLGKHEFTKLDRAERRFKALNPQGCIDFCLPAEGLNQYLEAMTSHGAYWYDTRFSEFLLLQLFSQQDELEKIGREEIGVEVEGE